MSHLATLPALLAGLAGLLLLFYVALHRPVAAAALLLGTFVLTEGIRDRVDLSLTVSGFRLTAMDVLAAVFLVVGVWRGLSLGVRTAPRGLALAAVLFVAFHLVRGALDFGLQHAVTSTRGWLYFVAPLVYAATMPDGWSASFWRLLCLSGTGLALAALVLTATGGLHTASTLIVRDGQLTTTRPLTAAGALVVLQAGIVLLVLRWPTPQFAPWLALVLGAAVVLLEHRTVWVAAVVVGAYGFAVWAARHLRESPSVVFGAWAAVLLAVPILVGALSRSTTLTTSLSETTASHSTFAFRTESWQVLVGSHHSVLDLLTGAPAASSWERTLDGGRVATAVSPHDAYVDAYLRFGVPGLLVLLGLGWTLWRGRRRVVSVAGLNAVAVAPLLLSVAVYGVAYAPSEVSGLLLGVILSGLSPGLREFRAVTARARAGRLARYGVGAGA